MTAERTPVDVAVILFGTNDAQGISLVFAELKDPVGEIIAAWDRPNGLRIERVRRRLSKANITCGG